MKKKTKLLLIIALIIAVAAALFGVSEAVKARRAAGHSSGAVAGSSVGDETEGSVTGEHDGGDSTRGENGSSENGDDASGEESGEPLATLFFTSDYQAEEGFDDPAVTLKGLLNAAKSDGKSIDKVVLCGDYTNDAVLHDYQLSPDEAIDEIRSVVKAECHDLGDEDMMFVQGNHDALTDQIDASGLHEEDGYLIYVLNTEEDFPWKQGKVSGCLAKVRRSSAEMKECFDELIRRGETRPVFIAAHVPLHFTSRTSSRHTTGDNLYSSLIFDVLNDASKSLNIVYLFGHNHGKGWDCYLGGSSVYKAPGDSILIPEFDESDVNSDEFTEETLNFTYLNAGYTGYYMNCAPEEYGYGDYSAADETLTGTVFEIYPDKMTVTRYDTEGMHVLGHAGEASPYKGGLDEGLIPESSFGTETKSPQEIPLK